jgi:hypothetical protein
MKFMLAAMPKRLTPLSTIFGSAELGNGMWLEFMGQFFTSWMEKASITPLERTMRLSIQMGPVLGDKARTRRCADISFCRCSNMIKMLKVTFGLLALCLCFSSFFVWHYYAAHRSAAPIPATGQTYPLNSHGAIVYISSTEHFFVYGLMIGGAVCALCTVLFHLIESPRA